MPVTPKKDPQRVALGHKGMRARWGPQRVIRLDGLGPEQRAFIVELVEVARKHARTTPTEAA